MPPSTADLDPETPAVQAILGETYRYTPYGFQHADVNRLLPEVPASKIAKAFDELEAIKMMTIADSRIWFAETLNEVSVQEWLPSGAGIRNDSAIRRQKKALRIASSALFRPWKGHAFAPQTVR
jgi:hypothetical protein